MRQAFKNIPIRNNWRKNRLIKFKTESIFLIGMALLPFENIFIAPSAGWGRLSEN